MNLTNAWLLALAGLTAAAVATWAWRASERLRNELRSFDSFKGMHFEE